MTQDAPQKNIARAGNVRMPTTTFVLSNLACTLQRDRCVLHPEQGHCHAFVNSTAGTLGLQTLLAQTP